MAENTPAPKEPAKKTPMRVNAAGQVVIETMEELWNYASFVAKSALIPKEYRGRPNDILIAWQRGTELGFTMMESLESIVVVHGRTSLYAEAMRALIMGKGACLSWRLDFEGDGDAMTAIVTSKAKHLNGAEVTTRFSYADAKRAGIAGGDNWKKWLPDMLAARATSRHCRTYYPMLLRGVAAAEEMLDAQVTSVDAFDPSHAVGATDRLAGELENKVNESVGFENAEASPAFEDETAEPEQQAEPEIDPDTGEVIPPADEQGSLIDDTPKKGGSRKV